MLRRFLAAKLRVDSVPMQRRTEVIWQGIGIRCGWVGLVLTFGLVSGCANQLRVGSDYDRSDVSRLSHVRGNAMRASWVGESAESAGCGARRGRDQRGSPESGQTLPPTRTLTRAGVGVGQDHGTGRTGATLWTCISIERRLCQWTSLMGTVTGRCGTDGRRKNAAMKTSSTRRDLCSARLRASWRSFHLVEPLDLFA